MNPKIEQELNTFIEEWKEPQSRNKETFLHFKNTLHGKDGVSLDFIARPGVTYSLRATHVDQQKKGLFAMVDVIEDTTKWLSICFYGDMISDPEEKGDLVPGGLLGEDAICFDLEEQDDILIRYIETRLDEAYHNAKTQ